MMVDNSRRKHRITRCGEHSTIIYDSDGAKLNSDPCQGPRKCHRDELSLI